METETDAQRVSFQRVFTALVQELFENERLTKICDQYFCPSVVRFCFIGLVSILQFPQIAIIFLLYRLFGSHFRGSPSALSPAMHLPQPRRVISKVFVVAHDETTISSCSYCSEASPKALKGFNQVKQI